MYRVNGNSEQTYVVKHVSKSSVEAEENKLHSRSF